MTVPSQTDQLSEQKRKVDYDTFDITVKELLRMVNDKVIDIAPAYQRQFRWHPDRQSQFIESVYLGIPVPSMFMAANSNGTWELVDGVQRLSTLVHFAGDAGLRGRLKLAEPLELEGLGKLTSFNGATFEELPSPLKLQFELKALKIITISDKSDLSVRFDVFERLNTGGVELTPQEIRACIYRGAFNEFLETLANDAGFKTVVRIPPQRQKDGTPEEYVLRFFAFLHHYKEFGHSVIDFLNDYMRDADQSFDYEQGRHDFSSTFKQLARVFPGGLRRKKAATPVNLYEGIAVGAALAIRRKGKLAPHRPLRDWMTDPAFEKATTAATNNAKQVVLRIEHCKVHFGG
jgi:hypothetical protein